VVVGYGTQKKKDVTGSVVSVNEKALREVPTSNLQGALQGKAAGLEIQNTGTTPGSDMQIRIRGYPLHQRVQRSAVHPGWDTL